MSKGFASTYRVSLLAGLTVLAYGALGARLVWLHVIDRDRLLASIEMVRHEIIPEYARRGDIQDLNGALLATSVSHVRVGVDPTMVRPEDAPKWPELARLLQLPLAQVQKAITTRYRTAAPARAGAPANLVFNLAGDSSRRSAELSQEPSGRISRVSSLDLTIRNPLEAPPPGSETALESTASDENDEVLGEPDSAGRKPIQYVKLSDDVSQDVFAQILKLGIKAVYGRNVYHRQYPHNETAAHLIGYVNSMEEPANGIENFANFLLRGQNGWVETEKDGHGHELAQFRTREVPAADGYSVVLSLDATVQHMAEAELEIIHQKYHPKRATIIVSRPETGFILALANYPTFDLNHYNEVPHDEMASMQNIAVSNLYEPGSVFKIVALSGALEDGLVTPDTLVDCNIDRIDYMGKTRPLLHDDQGDHFPGPIPVWKVISKSSNRGAVQLGMRLGDERFYHYVQAFGFSEPTGFPVGGEPGPAALRRNVPQPGTSRWDDLTMTRMPAGYSVAVSPLQMHQAMSVIAAAGVMLKPQIVKQVKDSSGELVYRFDRVEERRVISEKTARLMARLLQGVASAEGTAPGAAIRENGLDYEVAGKTGTAQKPMPVTLASGKVVVRYSEHNHVGSFVGFFPASDPQVVISVVVDDADERFMGKTAYGSVVAAPSFNHLGEELIPYLAIRPPSSAASSGRSLLALEGGRR
jgi:cell division protein FtsI/penicillin-binding protein 2